jgi:hypothetical protein
VRLIYELKMKCLHFCTKIVAALAFIIDSNAMDPSQKDVNKKSEECNFQKKFDIALRDAQWSHEGGIMTPYSAAYDTFFSRNSKLKIEIKSNAVSADKK